MADRTTSLRTMVVDECANWVSGEYATGCAERDFKPCLALAGKRCGYFEKGVLPLADHPQDKAKVGIYLEAAREYALTTAGPTTVGSLRRCDCGAPLAPRHRTCEACQGRKAKSAYRQRRDGGSDFTGKDATIPAKAPRIAVAEILEGGR